MRDVFIDAGADRWVLAALVLWPLIAAAIVRLIGREPATAPSDDTLPADVVGGTPLDARVLTLGALVIEALLGFVAWSGFDAGVSGMQLRVQWPWLTDLGASFSLGVDGVALPMLVLTTTLMPLALLATWREVRERVATFGALVLVLTSGLVGVFAAIDLLLFYCAWELMLIPMYFLIGIWGGAERARAGLQYVVYTLFGSLLMLVAIIVLYRATGGTSFELERLAAHGFGLGAQVWLFVAFFLAFAIKSAMVPFHTWLPRAQSAAPTIGAVVLGLKVGTYALLRFAPPLFPLAIADDSVRSVGLVLAVVCVLYGAVTALAQPDLRRVLSYSSISHLGFILLGIFALTEDGVQGALLVMLNHGIATSALFLLAGVLRERTGTDAFAALGGLAKVLPLFSVMLVVSMMATIALPGLSGFVGEFLVLVGTFEVAAAPAIAATLGVILAAAYALRALMAVLFGESPAAAAGAPGIRPPDLRRNEGPVFALLLVAMLGLGLAPTIVLGRSAPAIRAMIAQVEAAAGAPSAVAVDAAGVTSLAGGTR